MRAHEPHEMRSLRAVSAAIAEKGFRVSHNAVTEILGRASGNARAVA
jgi:hypothetical protein